MTAERHGLQRRVAAATSQDVSSGIVSNAAPMNSLAATGAVMTHMPHGAGRGSAQQHPVPRDGGQHRPDGYVSEQHEPEDGGFSARPRLPAPADDGGRADIGQARMTPANRLLCGLKPHQFRLLAIGVNVLIWAGVLYLALS